MISEENTGAPLAACGFAISVIEHRAESEIADPVRGQSGGQWGGVGVVGGRDQISLVRGLVFSMLD